MSKIKVIYKNGNVHEWEVADESAGISEEGNLIWASKNVTERGLGCVSTKHMEEVFIDGKKVL